MNYYIGVGGKLNSLLSKETNLNIGKIYSARLFVREDIELQDGSMIIWGGRNIPRDSMIELGSKTPCVYLSTFIYNDFLDFYQLKKDHDSKKILEKGWRVIYIPFIEEILPENVSEFIKMKECKDSLFYLYTTKIGNISEAISNRESLKFNRIGLKLSIQEKICWRLFSKLYLLANKLPFIMSKYFLILVKLIEKTVLSIASTHKLSCVYIGSDK
jgi:hypothetical protein